MTSKIAAVFNILATFVERTVRLSLKRCKGKRTPFTVEYWFLKVKWSMRNRSCKKITNMKKIYTQCKDWTRIKQGRQFSEQSQSKVLTECNNRDDVSNKVKIKESIINDFFSFSFLTTPLCDRSLPVISFAFYILQHDRVRNFLSSNILWNMFSWEEKCNWCPA